MEGAVRIDKWLWAVRLFKTRSLATDACAGGKVKVNGQSVKPARAVRPGDVIKASTGEMQRTVRVTALLEQRVGAKLVKDYLEDLTPESEYRKARERGRELSGHRPKGLGRPTKKQRRTLESYFNEPPSG